jgi:hypothetical protein
VADEEGEIVAGGDCRSKPARHEPLTDGDR